MPAPILIYCFVTLCIYLLLLRVTRVDVCLPAMPHLHLARVWSLVFFFFSWVSGLSSVLGGKHSCALSHLTSPILVFLSAEENTSSTDVTDVSQERFV